MGAYFWVAVWIMMLLAFTTAWTFIVKGCESMDNSNPPEHESSPTDHH